MSGVFVGDDIPMKYSDLSSFLSGKLGMGHTCDSNRVWLTTSQCPIVEGGQAFTATKQIILVRDPFEMLLCELDEILQVTNVCYKERF